MLQSNKHLIPRLLPRSSQHQYCCHSERSPPRRTESKDLRFAVSTHAMNFCDAALETPQMQRPGSICPARLHSNDDQDLARMLLFPLRPRLRLVRLHRLLLSRVLLRQLLRLLLVLLLHLLRPRIAGLVL